MDWALPAALGLSTPNPTVPGSEQEVPSSACSRVLLCGFFLCDLNMSKGLGRLGPGLPPRPSPKENAEWKRVGVPFLRAQEEAGQGPQAHWPAFQLALSALCPFQPSPHPVSFPPSRPSVVRYLGFLQWVSPVASVCSPPAWTPCRHSSPHGSLLIGPAFPSLSSAHSPALGFTTC